MSTASEVGMAGEKRPILGRGGRAGAMCAGGSEESGGNVMAGMVGTDDGEDCEACDSDADGRGLKSEVGRT